MVKAFTILSIACGLLYAVAEMTLEYPEDLDTVRLRWATDSNPSRKEQVELFQKMYPGIEVVVDPGLGGDQTKLVVQCATGTGPDIIDIYSKPNLVNLVETGILVDVTEYATRMGFGPEKTYPAARDMIMVRDRQYGFPCNVFVDCVIYNTAIFDDHGVPYPRPDWTYDDFIETARRINSEPGRSGEAHLAVAHWCGSCLFEDLLVALGVSRFSDDGLRCTLDSPEAKTAMRLYHDLLHVHGAIPTPSEMASLTAQGGWGSWGINWFCTGRAAMIIIGRWFLVQVPGFPQVTPHLRAAPLPRIGARESVSRTGVRASTINAMSPHWRQALLFLQYLASPEYGKLIVKDGDALPPNPSLAARGRDLTNEIVRDPEFHQQFIDAVASARSLDVSRFIDPGLADRWMWERLDKVENGLMEPEEAMHSLTEEINRRIRVNLERRADLRRAFEEVTARRYNKDWWRKTI